ncbi:MAG TPA: TonB-dependent receptor plug domain-containing protein [Longimicrobiaceae bacterium]|jgi:TonB-dependent SusC/RagA subfamily outer membrane receptor|nr:TonB-dependent receptor plug domain-containing protein [Longimicrobiaceae bacterium]
MTRTVVAQGIALGVLLAGGCAPAGAGPEPDPGVAADSGAVEVHEGRRGLADAREWRGSNPARVEDLLVGRFAGVDVTRVPGGGLSVRIRGASSIIGGGEPLYVIDGQTIEPGPGGALMGINPQDIDRIQVLKDAGDIAFYGARGGNGVVLITTKRGQ